MRTAFLVLAAVILALVVAPAASACSIAVSGTSRDWVGNSDHAIYGQFVSRKLVRGEEPPLPGAEYRYRFRIAKTYKGRLSGTITLLAGTEESTCEAGLLRVGERFGLLLDGKHGPWRIALGSFISKADPEQATRRRG